MFCFLGFIWVDGFLLYPRYACHGRGTALPWLGNSSVMDGGLLSYCRGTALSLLVNSPSITGGLPSYCRETALPLLGKGSAMAEGWLCHGVFFICRHRDARAGMPATRPIAPGTRSGLSAGKARRFCRLLPRCMCRRLSLVAQHCHCIRS